VVIDTTRMNVHELRDVITARFGAAGDADALNVTLVSFGYRNGIPANSDLVLDVRFCPIRTSSKVSSRIPHGSEVSDWVLGRPQTQEFLERLESLLAFLLPQYKAEGKSYLTVSLGCTGGRHRSVALAEELSKRLTDKHRARVKVTHATWPRPDARADAQSRLRRISLTVITPFSTHSSAMARITPRLSPGSGAGHPGWPARPR